MIDTHAHLMSCKRSIDDILDLAKGRSIEAIINVGMDLKTSLQALEMHQKHKMLYPTIGIHPCNRECFDEQEKVVEELEKKNSFIAIGETGLDYYWDTSYNDEQKELFRFHLNLARQYKLPLIIHNRQADDDVLDILKDYPDVKKVIHCFSGSPDFMNALLADESTLISFTASITFAKKGKTIQSVKRVPLDKYMIETDSPFIVPKDNPSKENHPALIYEVAKKIADVKEISLGEVMMTSSRNARDFFNLPSGTKQTS